jgi:hypothetical protein
MVIFDFNLASDISNWKIVNDVVMGGKSTSNFYLNDKGLGVFSGSVSLENNGGFSSVRYRFNQKNIKGFQKCIIKLKGDGKQYQFRIKSNKYYQESYKTMFKTTGDWQTIEILLSDLIPVFRGQLLNMPNFNSLLLEEVSFLIGNKKQESFELIIDNIILY